MKRFSMKRKEEMKAIFTATGADFLYKRAWVRAARENCALNKKKETRKTEFRIFAQRGDFL